MPQRHRPEGDHHPSTSTTPGTTSEDRHQDEVFLTSINGKTCNATGHIIFVGPFPLFTLVGGFATFFGAMGILGLLFNSRPAITWRA